MDLSHTDVAAENFQVKDLSFCIKHSNFVRFEVASSCQREPASTFNEDVEVGRYDLRVRAVDMRLMYKHKLHK